jgi:glycosyltransferase involved in cell wall biosynthesis
MNDPGMVRCDQPASDQASLRNLPDVTILGPRTKPLRALIVTGQSEGGIWHYVCSLARALVATGVEVALAAPFPVEPIEGARDIHIWPLGTRSPGAKRFPAHSFRRVRNHIDKIWQFHQAIGGFHPDIVHLHDRFGLADFLYFKFLKIAGVHIVYTAHDVQSLFAQNSWFDRARYRQADALLVHSSNGVTDLVAEGIEKSKIKRIPHANYLQFCRPLGISSAHAKSLLGIPPNGRSILFFGFVAPYKGLSVLIDALSLLRRADPDVYLVIAGRPGDDFKSYRRQIEELGLQQYVISDLRYIPFDEFGKFFAAADVVALPYRRIYQSGVLQVAYAFGRPVAVTNVGGLGDTVTEDGTGLVAPTADAHGVASVIGELLSNPARAEEMGER